MIRSTLFMSTVLLASCAIMCGVFATQQQQASPNAQSDTKSLPPNPNIDFVGFLQDAQQANELRNSRRLTAEDFIAAAQQSDTIILDARSRDKYELMHIKGAINLPFTDMTVENLAETIPDSGTRILIYCNNNFQNSAIPFANKAPAASLKISTWTALRTYGYTNVYELAPTVDPKTSNLPFAGSMVETE